jgi:ribose transport system substrate-binding protein
MPKTKKEKKIMKRMFSLFLCAVLLILSMAGCGSGSSGSTDTSSSPSASASSGNSSTGEAKDLTSVYSSIGTDPVYISMDELPTLTAKKSYTIGAAMTDVSTGWFKALYDHLNRTLTSAGVKVNLVQCNDDAASQVNQIETFIAQHVDAIIINPANPQETVTSALEDCAKAGIPVVAVDVPPAESAPYMAACVTDAYSLGKMVGSELATRLLAKYPDAKEIPYGLIGGTDGNSIAAARNKGARDGIAEVDTNKKIVEKAFLYAGAYSEESGLTTAQNMLSANPDLKCIIGTCDAHIVGATSAAEQLGLSKDIIMGAVDGSKAAYEIMVAGGPIVALGLNSPYQVGEAAARVILGYLNDGTLPASKTLQLKPTLVTPDNVKQYYDPSSAF